MIIGLPGALAAVMTSSIPTTSTPTPTLYIPPELSGDFLTGPTSEVSGTTSVIGPLTTTFTPPASCSSPLMFEFDSINNYPENYKWGFDCANQIDPDCFPSSARANTVDYPYFPVFTPAVGCPHGWASACGVSRKDSTSAIGDARLTGWVDVGGELEICCPSGWVCNWLLGPMFATPSSFFNGQLYCQTSYTQLASTLQGRSCPVNNFSAIASASFSTLYSYSGFGFANAIALVTGPTITPSPTQIPSSSSSPLAAGGHSSNLSTDAKIAIGAGVGGGALVGLALVFIYLVTRTKRHRLRPESTCSTELKAELEDRDVPRRNMVPVELETMSPSELDGSSHPIEIDQKMMFEEFLEEEPPLSALQEME